jgi:peptide/nickel transport system substrate-binding protein
MFGYDPSVKGYRHDPAKARQLLAEAGYPDGLEITLESPAGRYQGDKEMAEGLGGQWQKAGFKPKVRTAEWGTYFKRYLGKQFQDAYRARYSAAPCRTATSCTTSSPRRAAVSTTRATRWTRSTISAAPRSTRPRARRYYADLARAMVRTQRGLPPPAEWTSTPRRDA